MDEARESLASAATTAELREFVARWVGPMVLRPDGTVVERTLATEDTSEASVKGLVAGARVWLYPRPPSGDSPLSSGSVLVPFTWGPDGVMDAAQA
jgi:hypothetical protein